MKLIKILTVVFVLVLFTFGCGSRAAKNVENNNPETVISNEGLIDVPHAYFLTAEKFEELKNTTQSVIITETINHIIETPDVGLGFWVTRWEKDVPATEVIVKATYIALENGENLKIEDEVKDIGNVNFQRAIVEKVAVKMEGEQIIQTEKSETEVKMVLQKVEIFRKFKIGDQKMEELKEPELAEVILFYDVATETVYPVEKEIQVHLGTRYVHDTEAQKEFDKKE